MAETADHARDKLSRATSNGFRILFALAAVIAAGATYLAITDTSTSSARQPGLFWLLIANLIIIAGVATVLGSRVMQLLRENKETGGGARLRLRIILLFSLAAAVPTVIVAGFLAVAINRSVENWFSEPVKAILESARGASAATARELTQTAANDLTAVARDIQRCGDDCVGNEDNLRQVTLALAQYRDFPRVTILNAKREVVLGLPEDAPVMPSDEIWDKGTTDAGVMKIYPDALRGMAPVPGTKDWFVHVVRPVPAAIGDRLQQTSEQLDAIQRAEQGTGQVAIVLTLSYLEAALLMLLGTAWLGMAAAGRIAGPIGELAGAARAVRDGDLSIRMERPRVRDEIDDLTDAFNQMTDRLARQTQALDRGRIDAETRSAFIEAVLAGVEAGVVRVDADLKVTIANASAEELLEFTQRSGGTTELSQIAPDFVAAARKAIETGTSVETSVKRAGASGVTHLSVRAAPEIDGSGAVITFHDTTRLIMGQRQAAWRDVARRIAHEIRNPLTPIQLSAERLKRRFSQQITSDRETFERCTETITRQVADIGRMVEEFSGFARMPKPTFGDFDLVNMVQAVAFSQRMATPGIAVGVNPPSKPITMRGDERMLAQALTNVVKNAAEALERGIEAGLIKTGAVSIDIAEEGEEVQLTIRDNGPGFPVQDRDRLLEPYVTTRKNGVGLGLAIVTRIVEDHGGRIRLSDNDLAPSGAKVDIRMPVKPELSDELVAYAGEGVA